MTIMPRGLRSSVTQIDAWCSMISPSMRDTTSPPHPSLSSTLSVNFLHPRGALAGPDD